MLGAPANVLCPRRAEVSLYYTLAQLSIGILYKFFTKADPEIYTFCLLCSPLQYGIIITSDEGSTVLAFYRPKALPDGTRLLQTEVHLIKNFKKVVDKPEFR